MVLFQYNVVELKTGREIIMTKKGDLSVRKKFFLAGDVPISRIRSHMDSLTDDLCEGFFPKVHVKTKKKPADK